MERPDGQFLDEETTHTREGSSESPSTTSRMVDISIGLDLNENDEDIVVSAFSKLPDHAQSLNQSLSYIKGNPLLLDFELKKVYADRDPRVQLAIWKVGGLKKMQYHGWDTSMPMPGITVYGDEWTCYLFFVRGSGLVGSPYIPAHSLLCTEFDSLDHAGPSEDGIDRGCQRHLQDCLQTLHPHEVGEDGLRDLVQEARVNLVSAQGCGNHACGCGVGFAAP